MLKNWLSNLDGKTKFKKQFLILFIEEFINKDYKNTISKLYFSRQKKRKEKRKAYPLPITKNA